MDEPDGFALSCPVPISDYPHVLMAHGGGGRLMKDLIDKMFLASFEASGDPEPHDSAVLEAESPRLAFTTDSYVVSPLFFPGGDIGALAVYGTVNDLAMAGAEARFLSAGFILEEGLDMETLWRVIQSMSRAAEATGVLIVTGDTKVVERGKGDGIFINTSGVGTVRAPQRISPRSLRPGDAILLSGDVGRHGIAVMARREGIDFEVEITSDLAPLNRVVMALLDAEVEIHCLRDLTRGGLSSALNEIAQTAGVGMAIDEARIPVSQEVRGACELLGFDPLYVPNEGRFVAFIASPDAEQALRVMQAHPQSKEACPIGQVTEGASGRVTLKTRIGTHRILPMLSGEQLPRIC